MGMFESFTSKLAAVGSYPLSDTESIKERNSIGQWAGPIARAVRVLSQFGVGVAVQRFGVSPSKIWRGNLIGTNLFTMLAAWAMLNANAKLGAPSGEELHAAASTQAAAALAKLEQEQATAQAESIAAPAATQQPTNQTGVPVAVLGAHIMYLCAYSIISMVGAQVIPALGDAEHLNIPVSTTFALTGMNFIGVVGAPLAWSRLAPRFSENSVDVADGAIRRSFLMILHGLTAFGLVLAVDAVNNPSPEENPKVWGVDRATFFQVYFSVQQLIQGLAWTCQDNSFSQVASFGSLPAVLKTLIGGVLMPLAVGFLAQREVGTALAADIADALGASSHNLTFLVDAQGNAQGESVCWVLGAGITATTAGAVSGLHVAIEKLGGAGKVWQCTGGAACKWMGDGVRSLRNNTCGLRRQRRTDPENEYKPLIHIVDDFAPAGHPDTKPAEVGPLYASLLARDVVRVPL